MGLSLFIGSSSESTGLAEALQLNLEGRNEIRPTVWTQGIFQPSSFALDSLREAVDKADFGVFLFAPDDVLKIRGEERSAVRDNVIFELGLFMGTLGRTRTFVVKPRAADIRMPSDLFGLIAIEYDAEWADREPQPALGPTATKIANQATQLGSRPPVGGAVAVDDDHPDSLRRRQLREMLDEPNPEWRRLQTLCRAVGASEEHTRDLLIQVGARGSVTSGPELWGLTSRVGRAG